MYAYGTRVMLPQGDPRGRESAMSVTIDNAFPDSLPIINEENQSGNVEAQDHPWEQAVPLAECPRPELPQPALEEIMKLVSAPNLLPTLIPTPLPDLPAEPLTSSSSTAQSVAPASALQNEDPVQPALESQVLPLATSGSVLPVLPLANQATEPDQLPEEYSLRQSQNRLQLAMPYGADADSEAAVEAGLQWLATAQSPDGAWIAKQFGGGTETQALGEHRHGTGDRADTGISGLALLAFLSAGHTHHAGSHQDTVRRGLAYLIQSQMPSGDLSGPKQIGQDPAVMNAKMYCHGIATLALAEAYAMTHDKQIEAAVLKAAKYTINAQDRRGGGWRYRAGDPGDLSLFGWHAMGLRSIQRSGISVPTEVTQPMQRFLESCATGTYGGLARYRPHEGRPSETMTAESLACRLFMHYPLSAEAQREAKSLILSHLPGSEPDNVYYWYYATLALFQLQDADWRTWNQAMKSRLLQTQVPAYRDHAGSWEPDQLWGGYGGRVYSTSMSCLCLEVYYRYLPLYQHASLRH